MPVRLDPANGSMSHVYQIEEPPSYIYPRTLVIDEDNNRGYFAYKNSDNDFSYLISFWLNETATSVPSNFIYEI